MVGTGFGCRIHVPALRAAGFKVLGLVGTRPDRLEKKAAQLDIPAFFTDLDDAVDQTGARLVTIATPPATHASLALAAIARECHVLCEKPFASNAAEGLALLDAAERAGVVHMVSHEFRWLPERALFGRAIVEGMIGEPRFLAVDQFIPFCADPETRLPKWWFDVESGGGWLGASGSHTIDQVLAWLGDFASLSANLMVVSDRVGVAEDSYSMRFLTTAGVEGSLQQTAGAWGPSASLWRCAGSKGTLWLSEGKVFLADKAGSRELPLPADLCLPPAPAAAQADSPDRLSHFEIGPFTRLCEALRAAIEGRAIGDAVSAPTFRDGLATIRVMEAIRASARLGGDLISLVS